MNQSSPSTIQIACCGSSFLENISRKNVLYPQLILAEAELWSVFIFPAFVTNVRLLQAKWKKIQLAVLQKVVESWTKRFATLIAPRGSSINY